MYLATLIDRSSSRNPFVLELHNASGLLKPLCLKLGIAHVNINGNDEMDGENFLKPDLLADLSLVFSEMHDPLDYLIEYAAKYLGPRYTRDDLLLVSICDSLFLPRHTPPPTPAPRLRPLVRRLRDGGVVCWVAMCRAFRCRRRPHRHAHRTVRC